MSRYFKPREELQCFICGGAHGKRDCRNRICTQCQLPGHVRCQDKVQTEYCSSCGGRHPVKEAFREEHFKCMSKIFSEESLAKAMKKNTVPLCSTCGATDHLNCGALPRVDHGTNNKWYKEVGFRHCLNCGNDGHPDTECRHPGFITALIRELRNQEAGGRDPRHGHAGQPKDLTPGNGYEEVEEKIEVEEVEEAPTPPKEGKGGRSPAATERRRLKEQKKRMKKKKEEERQEAEKNRKKKKREEDEEGGVAGEVTNGEKKAGAAKRRAASSGKVPKKVKKEDGTPAAAAAGKPAPKVRSRSASAGPAKKKKKS